MPHPAGAGGLPPLGLHRPGQHILLTFHSTSDTDSPSKAPDLGVGEAAGSALLLLDVEGDLAAPPAQRVRLVASLSKGAGSLGHPETGYKLSEIQRLVTQARRYRGQRWCGITR